MFDIGWSELFVIAVVAIIVVGPKDLPRMLRTFGNWVARMKRMAGDFQRQFSEALREAELDDVKKSIEDISKIDPLADVKDSLEPAHQIGADINHELRKPFSESATPTPASEPGPVPEAAPAAAMTADYIEPLAIEDRPEPAVIAGGGRP